MAKKIETIVTLTDDLDGSKADRTVAFSVDGTNYEIDLSKKNAAAFAKAVSPYVGAARQVRGPSKRGRRPARRAAAPTSSGGRRAELSAIRAWAKANGHPVSDRGRIPAKIVEEYRAGQ
jgi:hypothetical protein